MSIKVLVVDDSALMRKILGNMVQEIESLDLVDVARNGQDALKSIERVQPDIITLDVEMPIMNGIETLKAIKEKTTIPVIMLSARNDKETTIRCLELGAVDFLEKPINIKENWEDFKKDLEKRIKVHFINHKPIQEKAKTESTLDLNKAEAVVIGSSTGGPRALLTLIRSLPKKVHLPIFIVQHMPAGFTASFAKRLDTFTQAKVVEAEDDQEIKAGMVYLAPGGKHMVIENNRVRLNELPKRHSVRPAVDYLFETAAHTYKEKLVGIVLTGMGHDGVEGCKLIKQCGGQVLTQDKETSVVYGMPRNVSEKGYSDKIASLNEITDIVKEMVG
jgi:two-component system chemotaxis response regulator CheB